MAQGCIPIKISWILALLDIEVVCKMDKLNLSQCKYIFDLLQETGMLDSKPTETSMVSSLKLKIDEGELFGDCIRYKWLIGKLIYLMVTRSDVSFTVSVLSRFMDVPRHSDWEAACRVLRYPKSCPGKRFTYKKNSHYSSLPLLMQIGLAHVKMDALL